MNPKQTDHQNTIANIHIQEIDPSPFQKRRYFDDEKLNDLASSIQNDGLIEPIVVRPQKNRYELIAGERRLRAVRQYTDLNTIQAKIIYVDDLQARRICAAENIQREGFSALETIEAIVEIVDAHLIEDTEYAAMGNSPDIRIHCLLSKMNAVINNQHKQSQISEDRLQQVHKFVNPVENIFKKLPKRLEWKSFLVHDLPLVMGICEDIREISLKNQLNKSQLKAISDIKKSSPEVLQHIVNPRKSEIGANNDNDKNTPKSSRIVPLKEMSAREIRQAAEKIIKKEIKDEQSRHREAQDWNLEIKLIIMLRLGISKDRIARQLEISKHRVKESVDIIKTIQNDLKIGTSVSESAKNHQFPEPLGWHMALEQMTDQERFKALNWGLLTWDHWYWNDLDYRFGDDWPGRIPAQLVAHTLFYFTKQGQLVFDPMAGGGVVPDVCLAFHRRCWSFDLVDRKDKRPEIEVFQWDPSNIQWPVNSKQKPDLIFIDPPYFKKKADDYAQKSISNLSKTDYLAFFRSFLHLARDHAKPSTRLAFLNADWRNFQGRSALEENASNNILISDYFTILSDVGWEITQFIDCPMSTQRFHAGVVSQMQKKRTLGVVRRTLMIARIKQ
jgi:ParB/RepB/Spo0J family partition protein